MSDKDKETVKDTQSDALSEEKTVDVKDDKKQEASSALTQTSVAPEDWGSLSGKTQERIKQLIRERNEWKDKAATNAQKVDQSLGESKTQPAYQQDAEDEVTKAITQLRSRGMVTQEDVKKELEAAVSHIETNRQHDQLESRYGGKDGLPKYDREEVEDYARKNNIWNLEAAFRDMYFDEFVDSGRRKLTKSNSSQTGSSERSAPAGPKETLTLESFRQKLKDPEYAAKMLQNPQKLDALIAQLTSEQ